MCEISMKLWDALSQGLRDAKPSRGLGFVFGTGLCFVCPWPTAKGQRQRKQDYRKARRWTTPSTLQSPLSATCLIHSGAFSIKAERLRLVKATKSFFPCVGRKKLFSALRATFTSRRRPALFMPCTLKIESDKYQRERGAERWTATTPSKDQPK